MHQRRAMQLCGSTALMQGQHARLLGLLAKEDSIEHRRADIDQDTADIDHSAPGTDHGC